MTNTDDLLDLKDIVPSTDTTKYTLLVYAAAEGEAADKIRKLGWSTRPTYTGETVPPSYHMTLAHYAFRDKPLSDILHAARYARDTIQFTKCLTAVTEGLAMFKTPDGWARVALMHCPEAHSIREALSKYPNCRYSEEWYYKPHITLGVANSDVATLWIDGTSPLPTVELIPTVRLFKREDGIKKTMWVSR